jgi:hypothetical protein
MLNGLAINKLIRVVSSEADNSGRNIFARSDAPIVGSNPTQSMDICVTLFCVCVVVCVGNGLATG